MKKLLVAVFILFMSVPAFAGYESVTVGNTAVGLSTSIPAYGGEKASCVCTIESAPIRFRLDGTSPTATEGHMLTPDASLMLQGGQISKFKAISLNGTNATLKCSCNDTVVGTITNLRSTNSRTTVNYYANNVAAGATGVNTAITLNKSYGLSTVSTGTSFVIPAGKKFRITEISVATRGHVTATAQSTLFSFMTNTAGIISNATNTLMQIQSATAATSLAWDRVMFSLPDGFELQGDGTAQWGFVAAATFTTNAPTWSINIIGYEY
jgi:hypothetical protein